MGGVQSSGRFVAFVLTLLLGAWWAPPRADALEAGPVQLHGFYENQTRVLSRNFDGTDDFDLAQWYQVLNLEFEFDIAPDGFAFFDIISAYARVEARFNCVYDHGCGMFNNVNTFGDQTRHLPKRLSDARRSGNIGNRRSFQTRKRHGVNRNVLGIEFGTLPPLGRGIVTGNSRRPAKMWNVPGIDTLFGGAGPNGTLESVYDPTSDDPARYIMERFIDFEFALRKTRGSVFGNGTQVLGPWLPKNFVDPIGALADRANPFSTLDPNVPVLGGATGANALPFRPAPTVAAGRTPVDQQFARGVYYPNAGLQECIRNDCFDATDQNFRESELKWNRGASQQQTHFLKEAYIDIELFDSALWLRIGKQSIVWGKTELFRTTDQFNPQDVALSTLPSLEESRIALWAGRAVWSLWQVGPLEDVRLEFAFNFDAFQGADFGQCGEPYTVNAACNLRAGMFAHGLTGFGLAGIDTPDDPWADIEGLEVGFRMEFRWGPMSFAITDFYGYDDFPYVDQLFRYERNVDPFTGLPRRNSSREPCDPSSVYTAADTRGCLTGGVDALQNHHANQQLYAFICSTSIGFSAALDARVCAQSIFNSTTIVSGFPIAEVIGSILTGDPTAIGVSVGLIMTLTGQGFAAGNIPLVDLGLNDKNFNGIIDPDLSGNAYGPADENPLNGGGAGTFLPWLDAHLSPEQRALLGCGTFWGYDQLSLAPQVNPPNAERLCNTFGIDLLNAEASALTSAWNTQPGIAGATFTNLGGPAPGTVPFVQQNGRFWCQRFVKGQGNVVLPGCRAPGEFNYNPFIDGNPALMGVNETGIGAIATIHTCTNPAGDATANSLAGGWCGRGNPFTGEQFNSVMDAVSWNFLVLLVFFSSIGVTDFTLIDNFNPADPVNPNKCSFAAPQFCSNVSALLSVIGRRRNSTTAGGTHRFGRADFVWHGGTSNRAKYRKRNVLGFSADFAEDRTKTNWSVETTWFHKILMSDNDALDGVKEVDTYNLTVSMDRPTFINFLNQGRTFFINSQWFFRYIDGYEQSMPSNGPFNVLATLTAFTGFYQDRLNPSVTLVYDFMSESGAILPSIGYRFNESFSVEFGMAFFYGKWQSTRMPVNPISLGQQVGSGAYREFSERGLAIVRDRDEAFVRIRKTF